MQPEEITTSFERYDSEEIQNLLASGWEIDSDGINEQDALEMTAFTGGEYRLFRNDNGLCTILVPPRSAYEGMEEGNLDDINQTRRGVQGNVNEVMGKGGTSNRA